MHNRSNKFIELAIGSVFASTGPTGWSSYF